MDKLAKTLSIRSKPTAAKAEPQWVKFQNLHRMSFVGNVTVAFGCDQHILFVNYESMTESVYLANSDDSGDGVACLAGHPIFPLFAFAELKPEARIFVLTYPEFGKITVLKKDDPSPYLSICFSDTEHLIALCGAPKFMIQVWYWRSNEMLVEKEANQMNRNQIIGCGTTLPPTVCQLATLGANLNLWELHGTVKLCKLVQRRISLEVLRDEGILNYAFAIDGTLYFITGRGNLYHVYSSSCQCNLSLKWEGSITKDYDPCLTCIPSGIIVASPDGYLRHYKKVKGNWTEQWKSTEEMNFVALDYYHAKDVIIGITNTGCLYTMLYSDEAIHFSKVKEFNRGVVYFGYLKPLDDFIVAFDSSDRLSLIKLRNGETVSKLQMAPQCSFQEHPKHPFVVTGDSEGILSLINLKNVFEPSIEALYYLSQHPVEILKFSLSGDFLVILDQINDIYIIRLVIGVEMYVIQHFPGKQKLISPIVLESQSELTLLCLISEENGQSKKVLSISFEIDTPQIYAQNEIELPDALTHICNIATSDTDFYGVLYLKRSIRIYKLQAPITVVSTVQTAHEVRELKLHANSQTVTSFGTDGKISIHNSTTQRKLFTINLHSRYFRGVHSAQIDTFTQYLVTLGHSRTLTCTKLNITSVNVSLETETNKNHQNWLKSSTEGITEGFIPTPDLIDKRWLDIEKLKIIQNEEELFDTERSSIAVEFHELRTKLKNLMDRNNRMPDAEKIELDAFNLDKEWTDIKATRAEDERILEDSKMVRYSEAQTHVNETVIEKCWQSMNVKGSQIRGIFTRIKVDNFPLPKILSVVTPLLNVLLWRKLEIMACTDDMFLPWNPVEANDLERILGTEPDVVHRDLTGGQVLSNLTTLTSLTGTRSHQFISPVELRCAQMDCVTLHQINLEKIIGNQDIYRLREHFNVLFAQLQQTKDTEMTFVSNTNKRLRHIQCELNTLAELKNESRTHSESIDDPMFMPQEQPDTIVTVVDDEVPVIPYISPSHQKVLDAVAADNERLRLEMMADDFRDRALMYMMDGVLEHRWEDEIKKPVWKPACMLEKEPRDYDEADFKSVKDYQRRVKQNLKERDRYHDMLIEERSKLKVVLRDRITNFNYKVAKLELLKMSIDACIHEEEMRLLKVATYSYRRISFDRQAQTIKNEIESLRRQLSYLAETHSEIQDKIQEFKANYETLNTKDRMLDKQFKANFSEVAPIAVVDPAYKIFRRRPKYQISIRWATVPILLDLAKRIISRKTHDGGALLLPIECVEYMNLLDQMDTFVSGATGIDQNVWQILIRMRRAKIESEFKLKALGLQLAEAESTANAFSREMHHKRNFLSSLENKLENLMDSKLKESMNRQLQIVLKRGLIEIDLHGMLEDFHDCVLIHKKDIEDINAVIEKAGQKKLKAMTNAAIFRRRIITKEWEHKVLRLSVRDMRHFVETIEKVKITKEVQVWLKRRELGWEENLTENAIEVDVQNTITTQEKFLTDSLAEMEDCEKKIVATKRENNRLDRKIQALNLDIAEHGMKRNIDLEETTQRSNEERMEYMIERSRLVRRLQEQHGHILELSTMLELQKLRTFPTLTVPSSNRFR